LPSRAPENEYRRWPKEHLSPRLRVGCGSFFPASKPFPPDLTGTASFGAWEVPACEANKVRRFEVTSLVIRWRNTLVAAFVEQKAMSPHEFFPPVSEELSTSKVVRLGQFSLFDPLRRDIARLFCPVPTASYSG
jgi:hypothetical protein